MARVEGEVVEEELDAENEARRRLALAQIRQYPDVALKMTARPVERFDDELRDLVGRMKLLMRDAHGIGLAATQVASSGASSCSRRARTSSPSSPIRRS